MKKREEKIRKDCPSCGYANSYKIVRYGSGSNSRMEIKDDKCRRCGMPLLDNQDNKR